MNLSRVVSAFSIAAAASVIPAAPVRAELVLSQLVLDLSSRTNSRADIELWNNGPERTYVSVEPREVIAPGTSQESRRADPNPEVLGLLAAPARLVLEPGQRRLLRIAYIAAPAEKERVYRVTVKPVVGQLSSSDSGLKLLVGYDMLVLVRATKPRIDVVGQRSGDILTLRNSGNVSVELINGRACGASAKDCTDLPSSRLYAGAETKVHVPPGRKAAYQLKMGDRISSAEY